MVIFNRWWSPLSGPRSSPAIAASFDTDSSLGIIVLAKNADHADRIRELIEEVATSKIPPKSNRKWKPCFSKRVHRERNLIARLFWHFRRIAVRYDKLAANLLTRVQLASVRL